ncbi:baculoviral IAP repeat-containing protein 7-A isoform X2 [Patella vulgata]|uniref:baculoviral IAP repeat-containing protein 7-A isoform X2 n=1 Tax=Patella vulgata TaxID=6465 RepID=UPI00217F63B0|nr:baculoviral IAP repeat-containing protein 7-A isoform X2 [Patella vulgata]
MMTVDSSYVAPFTSATVFPEQSPEEMMRYETWRLKSFDEWPPEAYDKARPMALAKDGFYYTGTEDIVKCFSCGVQKGQWIFRSKPNVEHQRLNPECLHILGQNARNVSVYLPNCKAYQRCLAYLHDILLSEMARLQTFKDSWPHGSPSPNDLAKAGFSFTGAPDRVQCVFCNGILKNWQDVDIPMIEHRKHFPYCPFVCGHQVGNIPINVRSSVSTSYNERLDATQSHGTGATNQFTPVSGIHTERPRHPNYATKASRIASYTMWPSGLSQTPQQLAKAGFFYAGSGDGVKCFHCGGRLVTWERGEDPWQEHAKWFPKCLYLLQVKGEAFVQRLRNPNNLSEGDHIAGGSLADVSLCDRNIGNIPIDVRSPVSTSYDERLDATQSHGTGATNQFTPVSGIHTERPRHPNYATSGPSQTPQQMFPRRPYYLLQVIVEAFVPRFQNENILSEGDHIAEGSSVAASLCDGNIEVNRSSERDETPLISEEYDEGMEVRDSETQERLCVNCKKSPPQVQLLPCGHRICCICSENLRQCPSCRMIVRGRLHM